MTTQVAPHPLLLAVAALAEARHSSISDALSSEVVMGQWLGAGQYEHDDAVMVGLVALCDHLLNSVALGLGTTPEEALQRLALRVAITDDYHQFSEGQA